MSKPTQSHTQLWSVTNTDVASIDLGRWGGSPTLLALSKVTKRIIGYQVLQGLVSSQIRVRICLRRSQGMLERWEKEAWKVFLLG